MEHIDNNQDQHEDAMFTTAELTQLDTLRQRVTMHASHSDSQPRRRTTVKKLLGVKARVRLIADLEDGTHHTLAEVWQSTDQPMLDVLNDVNYRFLHDEGITWAGLGKHASGDVKP